MKKIEVYDPPMCCSSGVCGADVDPALVRFAGDLAWLSAQGVGVTRFNLAQQPAAFALHPGVASALRVDGNACLPLVVVNGVIVTRSIYPTRDQLAALAGVESGCCGGESTSCCG